MAPWPRGLYLCKKLQEKGRKVCYLETPPEGTSPAGLFLQEEGDSDEKSFLLSLGSLEKQSNGFCLVSEQGVWSFQEMDQLEQEGTAIGYFYGKKKSEIYKKNWLSFFAGNFLSRVFEFNSSFFEIKSLDLLSDYYLFCLSLEKKKQFQRDNPEISFVQAHSSEWEVKGEEVLIKGVLHKSQRVFFYFEPSYKSATPDWLWDHFVFHAELPGYANVIPSHFVLINQLYCPWTHSNLLSVFKKEGEEWEVWFRRPFVMDSLGREKIRQEVNSHLNHFFKSSFHFIRDGKRPGFAVYGGEQSFSYLKKERPQFLSCQENLAEHIKWEERTFQQFL